MSDAEQMARNIMPTMMTCAYAINDKMFEAYSGVIENMPNGEIRILFFNSYLGMGKRVGYTTLYQNPILNLSCVLFVLNVFVASVAKAFKAKGALYSNLSFFLFFKGEGLKLRSRFHSPCQPPPPTTLYKVSIWSLDFYTLKVVP